MRRKHDELRSKFEYLGMQNDALANQIATGNVHGLNAVNSNAAALQALLNQVLEKCRDINNHVQSLRMDVEKLSKEVKALSDLEVVPETRTEDTATILGALQERFDDVDQALRLLVDP